MNKTMIAAAAVSLGLLASACGSDTTTDTTSADTDTTEATTAETVAETTTPAEDSATDDSTTDDTEASEEAAGAFITTSETDLGEILVDANGLTVYGFTSDTDGTPTCEGDCEAAWPAVTVDGDELPEGLDPAVFSLVDGVGGTKQLKAGEWPLYYFASDAAAGDVNGQGVGDVWFVVSPEGELIK